jgi:Tfp pilus assembly protein PilF
MDELKAAEAAPPQSRPYIIKTYDRWIILGIVLVVSWFLFRPGFAVVAAERGYTFESQLVESAAEHYYKKAIAIDPAMPEGWVWLGELYYNFSHNDIRRSYMAADVFQRGAAAVPPGAAWLIDRSRQGMTTVADAKLLYDLGRVEMLRLHNYKKAEAALREAVQHDPKFEFAWDYLAYAALDAGDRRFALACWRQVLKLNPGHDSARRALAAHGG